ncbi:MAG: serine--tRNA ligase [Actinomycetota bacterium]
MIDLRLVREDPGYVKAVLARRGMDPRIDDLLEIDARRRDAQTRLDALRARQKQVGKEVPRLEGDAKQRLLDELKELSEEIKNLQAEEDAASVELTKLLLEIPNLPHESVPDGTGDESNIELRLWGLPPAFDFTVRDHLEIGQTLDILDTERASKVSGARFAYIKGKGALLELALVRFVVDKLGHHGFAPVIPPVLVRREAMEGTGFLPTDEQQIYKLADDDLYLVGTSEVSIAAMHQDEFIDAEALPLRYAGISTCFRREAGAYGKDTRGIFRVHQFDKVEMFSFSHPDVSWDEHEFLLACQEEIFQALEIPYRVVNICAGELGASAAKKYDIEAWLPGQAAYREVTSCSNCTDYQARRLKTRFRTESGPQLLHTLNGTAIAVGRAIVALLENHQRADGSVEIPHALRHYTGFDRLDP